MQTLTFVLADDTRHQLPLSIFDSYPDAFVWSLLRDCYLSGIESPASTSDTLIPVNLRAKDLKNFHWLVSGELKEEDLSPKALERLAAYGMVNTFLYREIERNRATLKRKLQVLRKFENGHGESLLLATKEEYYQYRGDLPTDRFVHFVALINTYSRRIIVVLNEQLPLEIPEDNYNSEDVPPPGLVDLNHLKYQLSIQPYAANVTKRSKQKIVELDLNDYSSKDRRGKFSGLGCGTYNGILFDLFVDTSSSPEQLLYAITTIDFDWLEAERVPKAPYEEYQRFLPPRIFDLKFDASKVLDEIYRNHEQLEAFPLPTRLATFRDEATTINYDMVYGFYRI